MSLNFDRSIVFVLDWEKEETRLRGELLAKWGISKRWYSHLNLQDLSKQDAIEIYLVDYWQRFNCESFGWPFSLAYFDTTVCLGPGAALTILSESNADDAYAFLASRLNYVTLLADFSTIGAGYVRRTATLLELVSETDRWMRLNT